MNSRTVLVVVTLVAILLFSVHVTDDIVRGFDKWGPPSLFGVLILIVWLCGVLLLSERRSGLIIIMLGGVGAGLMPVIHIGAGGVARTSGGFFFIWTLFALGTTGIVSAIAAARELRRYGRAERRGDGE